jgi:hypothetical protein
MRPGQPTADGDASYRSVARAYGRDYVAVGHDECVTA